MPARESAARTTGATLLLLLAVLCAGAPAAGATANLVHISGPNALCLDGSQAAFYWQPGSEGNKTWVFFLEGGGVCSHEQDCLLRAKTDLGSSKNFGPTIQLPSFQNPDAGANPQWHNANMVFLPYCTGDLHSGTRQSASSDTWGLHFSGHLIVQALISQLKATAGLGDADLVVFAGGSAGGMGVFANIDYVASQLPNVKMLGVPVGGFLFAHPRYTGPGAQNESETSTAADFQRNSELYQAVTSHTGPCAAEFGKEDAWKCLDATILFKYIDTPLYIVESQIDSVIMFGFSDVPEIDTPPVEQYVTAFRANSTLHADAVVKFSRHSIFSVCCFMHTNFDRGSPTIQGVDYYDMLSSAADAARRGVAPPVSLVDTCPGLQCGTNCPKFP